MYKPTQKATKQYKVSLKSATGNTVAFINFTDQFVKAVTGKSSNQATLEDILAINKGKVIDYITSLTIEIEAVLPDEVVDASAY